MSSYTPELSYYHLTPDVVDTLKNVIIEAGLAYIAYGMQAALTLAAVRILLRREARARFMLAAIVGLFVVSTLAVVTDIEYYLVQFPSALGTASEDVQALMNGLDIVGVVTVRLSHNIKPPCTMDIAGVHMRKCRPLVGAIVNSYWNIKSITTYERIPMTRTLVMTVPLLFTNIVATTLIGVKVWWYRREIKGSLGLFAKKSQVESVLMLLLETGFVYCVVWSDDPGAGFTPMQILGNVIPFITGLYPPVIVMITLRKSSAQSLLQSAQISHVMRFADLPDMQIEDSMAGLAGVRKDSTSGHTVNNFIPRSSTELHGPETSGDVVEVTRRRLSAKFKLIFELTNHMAMTVTYRPLNADDVRAMRYVIIETAVEYGCYGIHAALSLVAIAILVRHRGRRPGFMLAVVNILLIFSFIAVIGNTIYYLIQFPPGFGTSTRDVWEISANWDIATAVVKRFNYVASDAIVAWRVWIIWRDSRLVKAILFLCMCGSLAGAIVACVWTVQSDKADKYYRREIKACLGLFTRMSLSEKVLLTFLESGCLYILIWTAYIVLDAILGNVGFTVINFIGSAMPSVAGIYLTLVVIVVMTTKEQQSLISSAQISRAMRLAGPVGTGASSKDTGSEVHGEAHSPTPDLTNSIRPSVQEREGVELRCPSHGL
ncbi:uncharacterized protein SCHCODRAFT_01155628 [Schizophyllum commune H4-8]|uniref:Uncharacterized protein n=1 Tax=Schizophyllum commune (strain H4-8 / FGSC 9210) TaxID=578458 RepID=D8Q9Y5_SCHCM|nr:uncharacterized protein SCHCODRAFT_01155628 [Schizophyllum commune H4-8]KAI5890226.1 hypothetical protein SCHCODRAFT_01155628 [Schizophyllum commune H4-8]